MQIYRRRRTLHAAAQFHTYIQYLARKYTRAGRNVVGFLSYDLTLPPYRYSDSDERCREDIVIKNEHQRNRGQRRRWHGTAVALLYTFFCSPSTHSCCSILSPSSVPTNLSLSLSLTHTHTRTYTYTISLFLHAFIIHEMHII